jgi:hypothetical protein
MAADQGYCAAQRDYGQCLLLGFGVSADFSSAINYYIKAAAQNNIASRVIVAAYFCCGRLDNLEDENSIEWVNIDLNSHNVKSLPTWMTTCENVLLGDEGEQEIVCAIRDLRKMADKGHCLTQLPCGLCLQFHNEGMRYLKQASDQNEPRAARGLLNLYYENRQNIHFNDFEFANYCMEIAAWRNESITNFAMEMFAKILTRVSVVRKWLIAEREGCVSDKEITTHFVVCKFGKITQFDKSEWSELLRKSKTLIGNRRGLKEWMDGWCYENGIGVELDLSKAAEMYRKSGESRISLGQYHYGLFRCYGIGVTRNIAKGVC